MKVSGFTTVAFPINLPGSVGNIDWSPEDMSSSTETSSLSRESLPSFMPPFI